MAFNINQRLNGLEPLSYVGVNAVQPPDFVTKSRPPNATDSKNFFLGTIWLDTTGYPVTLPKANNVWMLVALVGNSATWVNFGNGMLNTLTGNTGGAVSPDGADNINVVGDGTTITIAGNPGTHTLTASLLNSGNYVTTLHTQDGNNVTATAGVINISGANGLATTGTVGPNTVTITAAGTIAQSFPTDSGTATPAAGVLNINANNAALGSGSSVLFSAPGPANTVRLNITDANSNTIIGNNAGNLTLSASNSVGLGKSVLHALTSGNANTILGSLSGAAITSGSDLTICGEGSGTGLTTATASVILGQAAGNNLTTETANIIIGTQGGRAGDSATIFIGNSVFPGATSSGNIFVGHATGNTTYTVAQGRNNNVFGSQAFSSYTTATFCNLFGEGVGASITSGSGNTLMGNGAGFLITTGGNNVGMGADVFWNSGGASGLVTGSFNVALGSNAGSSYTGAESNNILINNSGVVGESQVTRIGFGASATLKTFIDGIRGITTVNANAIAVLIDSAGQLGTVSSSRKVKDNIHDMASYSECIYRLRPVIFNYKNHAPESVSVGLIAEEVYETAPQLVVHTKDGDIESVKYNDLVPMLLNEIQKLNNIINKRDRVLEELLNRVRILEEKLI